MTGEQKQPRCTAQMQEYEKTGDFDHPHCGMGGMAKHRCSALIKMGQCPKKILMKDIGVEPGAITFEQFKQTLEGLERECRKDEREKAIAVERRLLDEVISLISENCPEMEGKRLRITPLQLCQKINALHGGKR